MSSCCSACDRFGHIRADEFRIEQCGDGDVLISEELGGLPRHEADVGPRAGAALDVAGAVVSRDAAVGFCGELRQLAGRRDLRFAGDHVVGEVFRPAVGECITPETFFLVHGALLEPFQLLESGWADVFKASQVHLCIASLDQFLGDISLEDDVRCRIALIIQILETEFHLRSFRQQAGEDVTKALVALAVSTDAEVMPAICTFTFPMFLSLMTNVSPLITRLTVNVSMLIDD
jgi:hypothetical protein